MVHPNSKKIKKLGKFGELVQQRVQKKSQIVTARKDLLKEYKSQNNKNTLEDKRFLGKKNHTQKFLGNIEKKQKKKLAFFNLDSDDEPLNMTHKGMNLDEMDDFKDNELNNSFSEDENINADMVNNLHFGGFDDDDDNKDEQGFQNRKKSKQEIYKELIHKSKKLKFLRQQQQFENEQKIEELDETFGEIFHLLSKNPEQYKEEKRKREKNDEYLSLQSQLAFDKRVKLDQPHTQDPKKAKKSKKGQKGMEEESSSSEIGIEEEIKPIGKKQRKLQGEIKNEKNEKKFFNFMDDIKKLKEMGHGDDDDSLDELDIEDEDEEDEYDEGEEGDEEDEDGEEDEGEDDNEEDDE